MKFIVSDAKTSLGYMKALRLSALTIVCILLTTLSTYAQGTRGIINGTVTDPNGAIVPGATVKLINIATQQTRTVQTNEEGVYQFLEVEPATYEVIITSTGFGEVTLRDVKVEPNRPIRLDTKLTVSGNREEVQISAAQELIDRETPTLGTTVDERRVVELPLDGRNAIDLALLQPGVVERGAGFIRTNGSRTVENNFQLDGSNNNEIAAGGQTGGRLPPPDAIQEFRLLTSNYEAEFGRNTGSIINVVTRSGGNEYHGNVRFFFRPTVLSAARFFDQNDPGDKPRAGTKDDFRRRYERKEFGGNFGGPLYLPRFGEGGPALFGGKNRSFFFIDYEGRRQLIGDTAQLTNLPTVEEKAGIFTRRPPRPTATNPNPSPIPLLNPATGQPFPIISGTVAPGQTIRQQIPASSFSRIGQYYLGFLPTGDAQGQASVAADEITNFDTLTMRIDPFVNDTHNFGFSFNYYDRSILSPFPFRGTINGANVPGFPSLDLRTTYNGVLRHTYTISPNLVNSFLFGYARNNMPSFAPQNQTTPAEIGFTSNFVVDPSNAGPPFIFLDDRGLRLGNTFQGPQSRVTENFQIQDSVSWVKGDHRFKFGFDGTMYKQNTDFLFINQAIIGYGSSENANTTGDDLADLIIGNSPGYIQFGANGQRDFRQLGMAMFAQDNWNVTPNLSLSLGLRWEYVGPLRDIYNRVSYYRPTAAARGISSQLLTSGQLRTFEGAPIRIGEGLRAPVGILFPGDPDPDLGGTVPDGGVNRDFNNFAPRVGFAYSPGASDSFIGNILGNRQTVIRGGVGVFYGSIVGDTALQQLNAAGYQGTNAYFEEVGGLLENPFGPDPYPTFGNNVSGTGTVPLQPTITNPFLSAASPLIGVSPITRSLNPDTRRLSTTSRAIDPRIRTPYVYQYNFTVERSFHRDYVLSLSYVGNRGKKLYAIEQVNPAYGSSILPYPASIPESQRFNVVADTLSARRANPDVAQGIDMQVAAGNSWYDSFQANLTRRYSKGLLFQLAYTFSKSITDTTAVIGTDLGRGDTNRGLLDLRNRRFGRSLSLDDVPHRFVGSFIYELPFARNSTGFSKTMLGGWSIGGIYTLESGRPFSVSNPIDTTGTGGGIVSFADLGEPFKYLDPKQSAGQAFNTSAFKIATLDCGSLALCARRGTSGPNQFRAKNGINNVNLILSKKTPLWNESASLELRFEAFNALNHTQFGPRRDSSGGAAGSAGTGLDLNLGSATRRNPNFGKFVDTRESRVIQLAARIRF
jgi:hypothetical protein